MLGVYLIYEAGNFRAGLELCVALRDLRGDRFVLFSPYFLPDTERYVQAAREAGLAYVHECTALGGDADPMGQLERAGWPVAATAEPPAARANPGWRSRAGRRLLRSRETEIAGWEAHYHHRRSVAGRFLAAAGAQALLLPEDNVERDSASWIAAMHDRGGRSVVVSYGSVTPHEAAIAYHSQPDYGPSTPADWAFLALQPRWGMRWRGRTMMRLPPARVCAMETAGLAPSLPWVVNSGAADAIAVESEFMRRQFTAHGVPAEKVRAVGTQPLDKLFAGTQQAAARRSALDATHGFTADRPLLLCALPPNQYPGVPAPGLATYDALVDAWVGLLKRARERFHVAVTPHPNIAAESLRPLVAAGIPVLEGGAAAWIPLCDAYLASVSSTIRWALACGKPVINYDCYGYRHAEYQGIAHVLHAWTPEQAQAALSQWMLPPDFQALAAAAASAREEFGVLDGQGVARLSRLLEETR